MGSLQAIEVLQKPKKSKTPIAHLSMSQPFIKVAEKGFGVPFHVGYNRKQIDTKFYCTGSNYTGSVDAVGFAGQGVYKYPHGVIYEGNFKDGQFHGDGVLIYPQGQRVEGTWYRGTMVSNVFKTGGNLAFNPKEYLEFPMRVLVNEVDEHYEVNCTEEQLAEPKNVIPKGCYDTGDGYYEPEDHLIYSYDHTSKRIPTQTEQVLIKNKYRRRADFGIGYLPDIYEYWTSGRAFEVTKIKEQYKKPSEQEAVNDTTAKREASLYICNFLTL